MTRAHWRHLHEGLNRAPWAYHQKESTSQLCEVLEVEGFILYHYTAYRERERTYIILYYIMIYT